MDDLDALFGDFVVEASIHIDATPEEVWGLVADVTRMPEFSPEVVEVRWVDPGPHAPVVGAHFEGTNRLADFEWTRLCTVTAVDRPKVFAYTVGDRFDGSPSGSWTFRCEPDGTGTRLVQGFAHAPQGRSGTRLLADQAPERAEAIIATRRGVVERGMVSTLEAIKDVIERSR